MKYLQILNAATVIVGAAMAIILAVVCLLYTLHVGFDPRLYLLTALFRAIGAAGAGAFLAQRRHWPARWLLQGLPVVPVLGLVMFLTGMSA
jgi:hypothetical protein